MTFSQVDLENYLDEALPPEEMARIEQELRSNGRLLAELSSINARRDSGVHSLGEIWRRHRLTCPTRDQLGSFLMGAIDAGTADYIRFHLDVAGCRLCQANRDDLERKRADQPQAAESRRRKYFQSSAGFLARK
jgi:hypothetical protein